MLLQKNCICFCTFSIVCKINQCFCKRFQITILPCSKIKVHTSLITRKNKFHSICNPDSIEVNLTHKLSSCGVVCMYWKKSFIVPPPPALPTALFDRPDCIQASTTDQAYRPNLAFSLSFSPSLFQQRQGLARVLLPQKIQLLMHCIDAARCCNCIWFSTLQQVQRIHWVTANVSGSASGYKCSGFRDYFTFDSDQAQIYSAAAYTAGLHDYMTVWQHGTMFVCMVWLPAESTETVIEDMLLQHPPPPVPCLQELHYCTKGKPDVTKIREHPWRKFQILVKQQKNGTTTYALNIHITRLCLICAVISLLLNVCEFYSC